MTEAGRIEPFSNHRWFLANSRLNVHYIAGLEDRIDEQNFREVSRRLLASMPHLLKYESLEHQGLWPADVDPEPLATFEMRDGPAPTVTDLRRDMGQPFADTGAPTYRANCIVADEPNGEGFRSLVSVETSHAITEGADLADRIRGRLPQTRARRENARSLTTWQRLAVSLIAPVTAIMHFSMSWLDPRAKHAFGDSELALDRATLRAAAQRLGVTQKALIFALVLYSTRRPANPRWPLWVAFSHLPRERAGDADDDQLAVRLHEIFPRVTGPFEAFAREIGDRLALVKPESAVKMALANRTQAINRFFWRLLPGLYRHGFFGYAPYDILLSMLPPVLPGGDMALFRDARIYAGSGPGRTRACIIVPGSKVVTLSFHADVPTLSRLVALVALADSQGIVVRARGGTAI